MTPLYEFIWRNQHQLFVLGLFVTMFILLLSATRPPPDGPDDPSEGNPPTS